MWAQDVDDGSPAKHPTKNNITKEIQKISEENSKGKIERRESEE
jgi:hypothetical protein